MTYNLQEHRNTDCFLIGYGAEVCFPCDPLSKMLTWKQDMKRSTVDDSNSLVISLDCTGLQNFTCVQEAPALTIQSLIEVNKLAFNPVVDNVTLFSNAAARRIQIEIAVISTLSGSNSQEGRAFTTTLSNTQIDLHALFPELNLFQRVRMIAASPRSLLQLLTTLTSLLRYLLIMDFIV